MLTAAIESSVCGVATWIVAVLELPRVIGENETEIDPVFGAADAAPAAMSTAKAAAAAKPARMSRLMSVLSVQDVFSGLPRTFQ
jgi:hypothetical protein